MKYINLRLCDANFYQAFLKPLRCTVIPLQVSYSWQDQRTVSHFYSPAHFSSFAQLLSILSTGKRFDDFIV